MKRFLMILSVLVLAMMLSAWACAEGDTLSVGDSFMFGSYEQDNSEATGTEPIEWTVLAVEGDRALLVSRYALDCMAFNDEKTDITWADSTVRAWLNSDFITAAFNDAEQVAICETELANDRSEGHAEWSTKGGMDTTDRVFLLSVRDVGRYFEGKDSFKTSGTEYARSRGAKFMGLTSIGIENTDWWLRSPGKEQHDAAYIGTLRSIATKQVNDRIGIRPAIWFDLTADREGFRDTMYRRAETLKADGSYAEAMEILTELDTYNNAHSMSTGYLYDQAMAEKAAGRYMKAIALLEQLGSYEDSVEQLCECRYAQALLSQESGNYDEALEQLAMLGQYKDSVSRVKHCLDASFTPYKYFADEYVNAGKDSGYSKSDTTEGDDPHFGWHLGQFFISGYTADTTDSTTGNQVFLKNVHNKLRLWFDLEQDIDALNGDKNLSISADTNGYDEQFGVPKTDFGRGTLIVRYTDYKNEQTEPQIYTYYLDAERAGTADTKVELNQEGDYEVKLDYEIKSTSKPLIGGLMSDYHNYSITIRFSIRNGNCMVYPKDVSMGDELKNSSVAPDGFYLDMARSRYLKIMVRRTVLSATATGTLEEDDRFNRPARDGERYTDEGIYTITVYNEYTGAKTEKTIFVGSSELLEKYVASGFDRSSLESKGDEE